MSVNDLAVASQTIEQQIAIQQQALAMVQQHLQVKHPDKINEINATLFALVRRLPVFTVDAIVTFQKAVQGATDPLQALTREAAKLMPLHEQISAQHLAMVAHQGKSAEQRNAVAEQRIKVAEQAALALQTEIEGLTAGVTRPRTIAERSAYLKELVKTRAAEQEAATQAADKPEGASPATPSTTQNQMVPPIKKPKNPPTPPKPPAPSGKK